MLQEMLAGSMAASGDEYGAAAGGGGGDRGGESVDTRSVAGLDHLVDSYLDEIGVE